MTTQTEAFKLALEALKQTIETMESVDGENDCSKGIAAAEKAITAIKEALAQPEQERNLKLLPREATREMLEAMDECSMEGYDEHLYAGHAASVYMAAWDAFTHPPVPTAQRKPLTDEQVREITKRYALSIAFPYDNPTTPEMFARAIEAAHGIKGNT